MANPRPAIRSTIGPLDLNTASSPVNRPLDRMPLVALSRRKLNALSVPICYLDRDERIRLANDAFAQILHRLPEQVTGHTLRVVLGPVEHQAMREHIARTLRGQAASFDREWLSDDGERRWYRVELAPDRGPQGEVRGLLAIWTDITALRQLQQASAERERQLRLFTDHIPGPILYLDANLRLAFVNQSWSDWTGLAREEVMGRTVADVLGPEFATYFSPLLERARSGESLEYERQVTRPGFARRWIRGRIVPDVDPAGAVRGYYLTSHDVSDLKLARDALAAREGQLRAIMDGVPAPVAYIGVDERYRFINLAFSRYFGVPRSAARDLTIRQIVGEEAYPVARQLFERALTGRAVGNERPVRGVDGRMRWMNVRLVPDLASSGAVSGVFVLMTDIHDLKTAQEALAAGEAQLRDIIDNVPSRIIYLDRRLRVRFANGSALRWFGKSESELVDQPLSELLPADRMRRIDALLARVLEGETLSIEESMPQPSGGDKWEVLHFAPHLGRSGEVIGVYSVATDVDEARRNQEALRRANWMLSSHIDNTPLAVVEWDRDLRLVHWSPQAEKIFGWPAASVIGLTPDGWRLTYEGDRPAIERMIDGLKSGSVPRATSLNRNYRRDGRIIWCEWYNSSLHDADGNLVSVLSFVQDVSTRIEAEERLQHLATHDSLTGLPNRVLLQEQLTQAIAHAKRGGSRLAVLFVDLDRFKNINDSLGHRIGDQLLRQIGQRLERSLREADTLGRLSGDEFIVVIDRFSEPDVPAGIAVKLLDSIAQPIFIEDHEIYVTASIGISMFPDDGGTPDELFMNADVALYRAKETGKNTMHFFSPEMAAHKIKQHTVEVALRTAIKEGGLFLHYQPIVRIDDGAVVGVEALIRWHHPERGLIPPHAFIPPAEESGLIHILGDWVLREACRQARAWHAAGLAPLTVAVNLSAKQFFQEDLAARIERTIVEEGCEPGWLKLEVTETSLLQDLEMIQRVLGRLKAFGLGVAIDDFGTGYSSLSHLKHFPIDTLKIDLSFIAELDSDSGDAAITESIIGLGRGLRLDVVAEGVETREQLAFLRARGCGYCQGNLFSRPLPAEGISALLTRARQMGSASIFPEYADTPFAADERGRDLGSHRA